MADMLKEIYAAQNALQARLGNDIASFSDTERGQFILLNIVALTDELHEALAETYWKPWAATPPGWRDRDKFVKELTDAFHFLLNLYLTAGVTAEELFASYMGKNKVNFERQDRGYTGNDKCDQCGRELDDPLKRPASATIGRMEFIFCEQACMTKFLEEVDRDQEYYAREGSE